MQIHIVTVSHTPVFLSLSRVPAVAQNDSAHQHEERRAGVRKGIERQYHCKDVSTHAWRTPDSLTGNRELGMKIQKGASDTARKTELKEDNEEKATSLQRPLISSRSSRPKWGPPRPCFQDQKDGTSHLSIDENHLRTGTSPRRRCWLVAALTAFQ